MADAKITLKTLVEDEELAKLNEELSEGQLRVKKLQQELKELQKTTKNGTKATKEQVAEMRKLQKEINTQTQANKAWNKQINAGIDAMSKGSEAAKGLLGQLKDIGSQKFGIDLSSFNAVNAGIVATATTITALVNSGREVSALSNQFIAFAGNAENAVEMYNKFNEVYRNSNYDEQKVYDMGKSLLAVGINADEAAKLVAKVADASASLGKGVETADMLIASLKRLATGSKLEVDQFRQIAEAGIDLSDVVEEMQAGGTVAFEALANKLSEYEGGMAKTKTTAAEMEGDIKANLIEIARQSALLVDEFLGFSDSLKDFYGWVINTSQATIDGLKNMIAIMRNAKTSADAYAEAVAEWEEQYHDIWEQKRKDYKSEEEWEAARALAQANYAHASADIVVEAEKEKQKAIQETAELASQKKVSAIAASAGSGSDRVAQEEEKNRQAIKKETEKIQLAINKAEDESIRIARQAFLVGKDRVDQLMAEAKWIEEDTKRQKEAEDELYSQRMQNLEEQVKYYENNPGLPGSAETLEALRAQMDKETELHELRVSNIEAEGEARKDMNADILAELGVEDNPGAGLNGENVDGFSAGLDKLIQSEQYLKSIGKEISQLETLALNTMGKSFASAFEAIVNGSKSAKEAFSDMVSQLLVQCANLLAQWTAIFAMVSMWKGPKAGTEAANKMVLGLAQGGYVTGPGTSTSDSIPAMLSNGEFVVNASAVRSLGVGTMEMINQGQLPAGTNRSNNVTLSINAMDASSFEGFLANGGLDKIKQALFDTDRNFAGMAGVW